MEQDTSQKPTHIYEIDFLRAVTVFSVVTIHSVSATLFIYSYDARATFITNFIIHVLHYNREMFIFVTGLVLTYVYYYRNYSVKKFWFKRVLLIFIPYVAWSLIYIKIKNPTLNGDDFFKLFWYDVYSGSASYQLYYILLALQFYAIFPFFLWFIRKVSKYPFIVLLLSFFIQMDLISLDFTYLQTGNHHGNIMNWILKYQDRIFLLYQFFFVAGAFAAIYINKCFQLLKKYGMLSPFLCIVEVIGLQFLFDYQINTQHESYKYTMSVLQPSIVPLSIIVIVFSFWLSTLWAKKQRLFGLIKAISDTSFGIYFIHVLILDYVIHTILPMLPSDIPGIWQMTFATLTTFISSLGICLLLLRIPFLSWTIGRVYPFKSKKLPI